MADELVDLAQPGVLSDPTTHAEYLTLSLRDGVDPAAVEVPLSMITNVLHSIRQKDTTAGFSITTGFSAHGWSSLFPHDPLPAQLHAFVPLEDGPRRFPVTAGDIFFMIKSARLDLNLQAAKYLIRAFAPIAEVVEDVQGFKYLDDRDLIDFVDGTENPLGKTRAGWVLTEEEPYPGGSYLVVQRYTHKADEWDALPTSVEEGIIGRTKLDDIEFPDSEKQPFAHNVKSKVTTAEGEQQMYRQNRAWGTAAKHGTMFVGFAANLDVIETSLRQMITADADGNYDKLLDFVTAETGCVFFVPPGAFIDQFA